jgi:hypothetical protein
MSQGRLDVVAGNHLYLDAGPAALLDGLLHVVAQRIADGDKADVDQIAFERVAPRVQAVVVGGRLRRQQRVAECQRAHRLRGRVA